MTKELRAKSIPRLVLPSVGAPPPQNPDERRERALELAREYVEGPEARKFARLQQIILREPPRLEAQPAPLSAPHDS